MNKQQTAVEWLINELEKTRDWQRVINEVNQSGSSVRDVIKEAKEMEKEQMIEFGCLLTFESKNIIEDCYNEIYGGNK
jgi:hypothetical protein